MNKLVLLAIFSTTLIYGCGSTGPKSDCSHLCKKALACGHETNYFKEYNSHSECVDDCLADFGIVEDTEGSQCRQDQESRLSCLGNLSDCAELLNWAEESADNMCGAEDAAAAINCADLDSFQKSSQFLKRQ